MTVHSNLDHSIILVFNLRIRCLAMNIEFVKKSMLDFVRLIGQTGPSTTVPNPPKEWKLTNKKPVFA